jgi:hypothetical protein
MKALLAMSWSGHSFLIIDKFETKEILKSLTLFKVFYIPDDLARHARIPLRAGKPSRNQG